MRLKEATDAFLVVFFSFFLFIVDVREARLFEKKKPINIENHTIISTKNGKFS